MGKLIAFDMDTSETLVNHILTQWDQGNSVLPLDQRLPQLKKRDLVQQLGVAEVITDTETIKFNAPSMEPDDALVIATSGTTGNPKGVVLSHAAIKASSQMTSSILNVEKSSDEWLCCLPVSHIGGFSVITRALQNGVSLKLLNKFDAQLCNEAGKNGSTLVSLVPTALQRVNASLFRKILIGGSAIPKGLQKNIVRTYGLTETGSGIVYDGIPLPGVKVEIRNSEIWVQTPTLFNRYIGAPLRNVGSWFPTGDAGFIDEDHKLVVTGRLDDAIITGGEKVWPALVEHELDMLGLLPENIVIGRPDSEWGESVTIVVVTNRPEELPSIEEVRDRLSSSLPNYALPKTIEIVDQLPRNTMGKIQRHLI